MASVNKVILIGNLGADPEVRFTGSGLPVATMRLATNERWTDKTSGGMAERTEWHRVIVWGKQAETCKEYLTKGRPIYVEGRLQTREWTDRDGNKRYTTEIVAQRIQFLGAPPAGASRQPTREQGADISIPEAQETSTPGFPVDNGVATGGDSDIPF